MSSAEKGTVLTLENRRYLRDQLRAYGQIMERLSVSWQPVAGISPEACEARERRRRQMTLLRQAGSETLFPAIFAAVQETLRRPDGEYRLLLEEMVSFRQSHTLTGAALVLHCHANTAGNWHRTFLKTVLRRQEHPFFTL